MNISVKPGKYVVAVSGGVDSMVLLDVLSKQAGLELVVAHFDHGIREDSGRDREFVAVAARTYGLPFYGEAGKLGASASEATARSSRYSFLEKVQEHAGAQAIVTAHHQDDLLETAVINMLRGTGRKGLSSLVSSDKVVRPFLQSTKQDIYDYASTHGIQWREDSTNSGDQYLRNYVRHHVMEKLNPDSRKKLLGYVTKAQALNPLIDTLLLQDVQPPAEELNRHWFIMLPYDVSCEVMTAWLRQHGVRNFDRKMIARLVVAAKVAFPGKVADINAGYFLKTDKTVLRIARGTRS